MTGKQEIRLALPVLHSVRVHWPGARKTTIRPSPEEEAETRSDSWELELEPGRSGEIRLPPAGKFIAGANTVGVKSRKIDVLATRELTIP
ncbi:MAG: hypothetical protein ACYTHK_18625 [Planctomycetota bacterium]